MSFFENFDGLVFVWISRTAAVTVASSSFIALSRSGAWWVRGHDFPRSQMLGIETLLILLFALHPQLNTGTDRVLMGLLLLAAILDVYRIFRYLPYSRLLPSKKHAPETDEQAVEFSMISSNVLQDNTQYEKILGQVSTLSPDIFVALETDGKWQKALSRVRETHPYYIEYPQDNTYGMLLYSKWKMIHHEIRFLFNDHIPSFFVTLQVNEKKINVVVVHPQPPRPQDGPSHLRDAELAKVAEYVQGNEENWIVIGDLNDVAWSHTTRFFLELSGLIDPRQGRGLFSTFPVKYPFLRFPLDHIFYTDNFELNTLRRLPDIGSDHFPIYANITLLNRPRSNKGKTQPEHEEEKEKLKSKGRKEDRHEPPSNEN